MISTNDANVELNKKIIDLYSDSSFEDIWGTHMHHGFYDLDATTKPNVQTSQIRLIEEALRFANVPEGSSKKPATILDVGCGIGGPLSYVVKKYGAKGIGIDIIPHNIQRGTEISNAQGLGCEVTFQVADALQLPFSDGQFVLFGPWSVETICLIKRRYFHYSFLSNAASFGLSSSISEIHFVSELVRVAAPGGIIILTTSCLGDLTPNEESLKPQERELLQSLRESMCLLEWISCAHYVDLFKSHTMKAVPEASVSYLELLKCFAPRFSYLETS
ncbi:hypothetical protein GIB67_011708 [Kingdonia uniflora]|uniref:Methyltransferase domain-containing protein n=1 Tax=Kingdonia uniflora TaxID=39325 RepID=A0A7J7LUA3_9MAGN|nr:hypothetical protein GIB67_011708 [Kingdonia uniflora]